MSDRIVSKEEYIKSLEGILEEAREDLMRFRVELDTIEKMLAVLNDVAPNWYLQQLFDRQVVLHKKIKNAELYETSFIYRIQVEKEMKS